MITDEERKQAIYEMNVEKENFSKFSEEYRADRAFVTEAISRNGGLICYASDELKACPQMTRLALKTYPWALEFVHDKFKSDPEFVLLAITIEDALEAKDRANNLLWLMDERHESLQHASAEIKEIIGDRDPIKVLSAAVLSAKISNQLKPKPEQTRRMKI